MKEPFNTKISVFKNLFNSKETPFTLTLTDVFERIKEGNPVLIEKINIIRTTQDKELRDKTKSSLLAIMFNGTFIERTDNSLEEHSGCCVLDFDKYPNAEEMQNEREKLVNDKHVLMVFTSPSGNGLKALIRIPKSTKLEHKRRFNAFRKYFVSDYFDEKNCNVSRVCFESYDPDIYLNQFCDEFTEIESETGYNYSERVPSVILRDESKIIERIMKFDFKGDFVEGNRNNFILKLAMCFSEYGISQDTAEGYILNNVVIGDFSDSETLTTIKSAYRKTNFDSKYFEDFQTIKNIQNKIKGGVKIDEIETQLNVDKKIIEEIKEQLIESDDIFWNITVNKNGVENITIEPFKYASFLVKNGFNKYYPETSENPTFVRVKENKANLSSVSQIKDFVLTYLLEKGLINVWNYCSKSPYLFTESHLNMIDSIHLKMLSDEKNISYIPFKNGVVKVTPNSVDILNYIDVDGYIWENQIINREFKKVIDFKNDFQDFIKKVSADDKERTESLELTLGYLVHSYKDKTDQKAVIFNDQEIDDNPNGGSGKSLVLTSLGHFRKLIKIDGKAFDPNKGDFVYQRVNLDTQVLAFDDVKKNFNFEQLFSLITEGITVNRKNKDEIFIPFERSPKIIITTNYVINGVGNSHERRRHEIEFYQYFNDKRSPLTEYKRLLFDSWNVNDWNKFDNYFIDCVQRFLKEGLVKSVSINADAKRFIQSTNKDFYDWTQEGILTLNKRHYTQMLVDQFKTEFTTYKDLSPNKLMKWVIEYAKFKGYKVEKDMRDNVGRYFELIKE